MPTTPFTQVVYDIIILARIVVGILLEADTPPLHPCARYIHTYCNGDHFVRNTFHFDCKLFPQWVVRNALILRVVIISPHNYIVEEYIVQNIPVLEKWYRFFYAMIAQSSVQLAGIFFKVSMRKVNPLKGTMLHVLFI